MCKYFKSNSLLRFVALKFCGDSHENDGADLRGKATKKNIFLQKKKSMVNCYGVGHPVEKAGQTIWWK